MSYGICNLSIIPARPEPSDKSEMVTQVLFGEQFEVLEEAEKWMHVKLSHDGYKCWIDTKQVQLTGDTASSIAEQTLVDELSFPLENLQDNTDLNIVLGSPLPNFDYGKVTIGEHEFLYKGNCVQRSETRLDKVAEYAHLYLNTPYLWGGRSPYGIDCSGLTQMVYRLCGIDLPRDSDEQAEEGNPVEFVEEAQEGDLAFFHNEESKITHVGIVLENDQIIHASGKVRIDMLDQQGIFNSEKQEYTHHLNSIKSHF